MAKAEVVIEMEVVVLVAMVVVVVVMVVVVVVGGGRGADHDDHLRSKDNIHATYNDHCGGAWGNWGHLERI